MNAPRVKGAGALDEDGTEDDGAGPDADEDAWAADEDGGTEAEDVQAREEVPPLLPDAGGARLESETPDPGPLLPLAWEGTQIDRAVSQTCSTLSCREQSASREHR